MSNEEKLNSLITLQAELQTKLEKLTNEVSKLKEEYDNLSEGKKKEGKEKKYSEKLSEKVLTKQELSKVNAEIKELKSEMKGKKTKKIVAKENGNNRTKIGATIGIVALAAALVVLARGTRKNNNNNTASIFGITNCSSTKETPNGIVVKNEKGELVELVTPAPKPFESYGNFTDASNSEQLYERAHWYKETYFNKMGLSNVITEDELVTAMSLFNGKRPINKDFEIEDLMQYNNKICNAFIFATSTFDDVKNGTREFIPFEYLFVDGSYEAKCAKELDEKRQSLIKVMNENNDEEFRKEAEGFGELVRDVFCLPSNTNKHLAVRGLTKTVSQANIYCLYYAEYTGNIMEYGIANYKDVCVPFCFDHNTQEMVYIPLSKLMATIEFIPMNEWDAVLQRAGISVEEIERMGNTSIENSYPVELVSNSIDLLQAQVEKPKTLGLK